jgi:outer membrane protein TolC
MDVVVSQYRAGAVDFNRILSAESQLADAELESAKNKDARIAACQKQAGLCRDVEKICQARLAVDGTDADVLGASAERLTAEIRLLREKAGDKPAEVESLLKERQDALRNLVKILDLQYRAGTVDFIRVASAESRLADAELGSAKNKDARIAACQKKAELCRDVEKICQARLAVDGTDADVREARAERLKAEIQLLREKAADDAGK